MITILYTSWYPNWSWSGLMFFFEFFIWTVWAWLISLYDLVLGENQISILLADICYRLQGNLEYSCLSNWGMEWHVKCLVKVMNHEFEPWSAVFRGIKGRGEIIIDQTGEVCGGSKKGPSQGPSRFTDNWPLQLACGLMKN